jgi:YD repeat-containing protein
VETQDPLGRVTGLGWCGCGSLETLKDPLGRVTSWIRDLQGRVISKLYPDRTSTRYDYDGSGRLIERIDAKGQSTRYAYGADDALKQVSYANADPPTPTVSYHYDPAYPRLSAINDGTGTTTFSYHPIGPAPGLGAGRLAVVTPPLARSSISYGYDELGRVITRDINGSTETRTFDSLGRLTGVAHALGSFGYDFIPGTHQLGKATYPNGQVSTYSYFDATGDHRLRQIRHLKADGGNLSSFGYTYEAGGQVRTWSQAADVAAPRVASFTYDPVGQLLGSVLADTGTNQVLKTYLFGYDGAGNRTTEQFNGGITTSSHNILNQLIDQALSATPLLRGDSPATPPRP